MKRDVCTFAYNREGILTFELNDGQKVFRARGAKALNLLSILDEQKFTRIAFPGKDVVLFDEDSQVIIKNHDRLYHDGVLKQCPITSNLIRVKFEKKKAQRNSPPKKKGKLKPGVRKVLITSAMILSIMLAGKGIASMADNNYPTDLNVTPQSIEQVIQNDNYELLDDFTIENNNIEEHTTGAVQEEDDIVIFENAEDNSMSQKAQEARKWYGTVKKYADRYGLSANLPMAVLTQESGGDNSYRDGLMQIQFWSWEDMPVRAYNFETGKTDTIILTKTPNKYKNTGYTIYTPEDLKNPEINIKCGVIFLRYSIINLDGNIAYGTFAYNMGVTNIVNLIKNYVKETPGLDFDEVIDDPTYINDLVDLAKETIDVGDWNYPNRVAQYAEGDEFSVKLLDDDGNIIENSFRFEQGKGLGH